MKRVVVTGIGIVSCLGNNQQEVYESLLNTKSGISFAEEYK
jgi:3-oxoacyl-[acyl-carrier-protein] synthase-1